MMKKLVIVLLSSLVIIPFFTSCSANKDTYEYSEAEWFSVPFTGDTFYDHVEPLIKDFNGNTFASKNITADGYYSGYTKLSDNGDIIYCEDNGSVIWCDYRDPFSPEGSLNGLMRMKKNGEIDRLCPVDECRENLDMQCTHMNFFYNLCYSDGFLYLAVFSSYKPAHDCEKYNRKIELHSYVLRYDTKSNQFQKLIDVDFNDNEEECMVSSMNINGRYLYLMLGSRWNFPKVIRVDLYEENAAVLIKDASTMMEKIGYSNWTFYDETILTAASDAIYSWDMNMTTNSELIQYDDKNIILKQVCGDKLYYFTYPKGQQSGGEPFELYRYDLKWYTDKEPVLLSKNISNIYIDDDTMYYTFYNEYDAFDYLGNYDEVLKYSVYNGNELFGVVLDPDRPYVNWDGSYSAYVPQEKDVLSKRGFYVKNGNIYTSLYVERQDPFEDDMVRRYRASVRVKPLSNRTDYIFYEDFQNFKMYKTE